MRTNLLRLSLGSLAVVACCSLSLSRADDDDDPRPLTAPAKAAILRLAAGQEEDPTKPLRDRSGGTADFVKQYRLDVTMRLFKPRSKNGLGIGDLTRAGHKDGIELLLRDYASKPPTNAEVERFNDDLQRIARITLVLAEIMPHYAPNKDFGAKGPADWRRRTDDMKQGALDFVNAVGARNPKSISAAAKRLNNACVECHKVYRDD